jgi:HAD superfamily hydrolase (TIGR01509 family)
MKPPPTLIFDVYDTLLRNPRPVFQREVSRLAPAERRAWVAFERDTLVVTPYPSHEEFVRVILERFQPGADAARHAEVVALLREELASIVLLPGVRSALQFLKRRGCRLGLLSNAATPYREPLDRLGLADLFDVAVYSCDEGMRKPDPRLFAAVCDRLGVAPTRATMVGDSLINDVRAATAAGLQAILVGPASATPSRRSEPMLRAVAAVADLGWSRLGQDSDGPWADPLLAPGDSLALGGRQGVVDGLDTLGDSEQGRYNVVARGRLHFPGGASETIYVKRFLHPAAVHIEALVHQLLPEMGIEGCDVEVRHGSEPLLVSAAAPGVKLSDAAEAVDVPLAMEIGRHFACGFLLANADLRPRNAFLVRATGGAPRLIMVDHEYCLVNRAFDLAGVADPFDRQAIEALGAAELERREARLVLTPQTMRRARRQFFDLRPGSSALAEAFLAGWIEVHGRAQRHAAAIRQRFAERLESQPPLIGGTLAYRRALTRFDLEELMQRIALDPASAGAPCVQSPAAKVGAVAP